MHPVLEEFCRVHSLQSLRPDYFRRVQRLLRDEVQPLLDQREQLIDANATLEVENADLKQKLATLTAKGKTPREVVGA
jgi:hypothetical protein